MVASASLRLVLFALAAGSCRLAPDMHMLTGARLFFAGAWPLIWKQPPWCVVWWLQPRSVHAHTRALQPTAAAPPLHGAPSWAALKRTSLLHSALHHQQQNTPPAAEHP